MDIFHFCLIATRERGGSDVAEALGELAPDSYADYALGEVAGIEDSVEAGAFEDPVLRVISLDDYGGRGVIEDWLSSCGNCNLPRLMMPILFF
jgi:hypothetical protein